MGEAKRRRATSDDEWNSREVQPGIVRFKLATADGFWCSVRYQTEHLDDLLRDVSQVPMTGDGQTLAKIAATADGINALLEALLTLLRRQHARPGGLAQVDAQGCGEATMTQLLWCVLRGPLGTAARHQFDAFLAKHGGVDIAMGVDEQTGKVLVDIGTAVRLPSREAIQSLGQATHLDN